MLIKRVSQNGCLQLLKIGHKEVYGAALTTAVVALVCSRLLQLQVVQQSNCEECDEDCK